MEEFRSGFGAAWLDFLVTRTGRYREDPREWLTDPAALQAWLARHDLAPQAPPAEHDVEQAVQLREALHAVTRATYTNEQPPSAAVRVLTDVLAEDQPLRLRRSSKGLRPSRPDSYPAA